MRSLVGTLADGMLGGAILIPPCRPIPPTNVRVVRGPRKKYNYQKNQLLVNEKKEMYPPMKLKEPGKHYN